MKYSIVTGASRGLGAALTQALLADPEQHVVAIARSAGITHPRVQWVTADLSVEEGVQHAREEIAAKIPRGNGSSKVQELLCISNAATLGPIGLTGSGNGDQSSPGRSDMELSRALYLNVTAPIILTRFLLERYGSAQALPNCRRRTIVHISSGAAERVMPGLALYSTSKAALHMFVRAAAEEWDMLCKDQQGEPTRIIAISPGLIDTEMQQVLRSTDATHLPRHQDYKQWHEGGQLVPPEQVAERIIAAVSADTPGSGSYCHIRDL